MNPTHRSAPGAGLPRGWLSRACMILILAAALAPIAAAGNADQPASAPAAPLVGGWAGGFGTPGTNHYVYSLAARPDGSVYVGGSFTAAGNVAANCIVRWDSVTGTWHALGEGMAGCDFSGSASVTALAVGPDGTLYAGGGFTTAGGVAANDIARWDGTA